MSFSIFVWGDWHNNLKCWYSSAQVGSGQTSVVASSLGRPLGKIRCLTVRVLGPHLHKQSICALPSSAQISARNVFRHESSVISQSTGKVSLNPKEKWS